LGTIHDELEGILELPVRTPEIMRSPWAGEAMEEGW